MKQKGPSWGPFSFCIDNFDMIDVLRCPNCDALFEQGCVGINAEPPRLEFHNGYETGRCRNTPLLPRAISAACLTVFTRSGERSWDPRAKRGTRECSWPPGRQRLKM